MIKSTKTLKKEYIIVNNVTYYFEDKSNSRLTVNDFIRMTVSDQLRKDSNRIEVSNKTIETFILYIGEYLKKYKFKPIKTALDIFYNDLFSAITNNIQFTYTFENPLLVIKNSNPNYKDDKRYTDCLIDITNLENFNIPILFDNNQYYVIAVILRVIDCYMNKTLSQKHIKWVDDFLF
jgi:hypothetical protein